VTSAFLYAMKKVFVFLFCFLTILAISKGQSDWSIIYDHDLIYDDYTAMEVSNDTLYLAHFQYDRDTNLFGVVFMKYDSSGYLEDTVECFASNRILSTYNHYSGFKIYNNTLYFYGTTNLYYTYLIKASTDFTQDTILYYPPNAGVNFTGATGLLVTESGLYLLAQQKKPGELNDIMVIHTDLEGKELWRKVYGLMDRNEIAFSIIKGAHGRLVIGGGRTLPHLNIDPSVIFAKELLLEIDTNGSLIKDWQSSDFVNRGPLRNLAILGDEYIYSSSVNNYTNPNNPFAQSNFSARDTSTKAHTWIRPMQMPQTWASAIWGSALTPDSNAIIGVGRLDSGGPAFHYKVNTQTGAVIYQRNLIGCTDDYDAIDTDLFDVASLSSGSTVACGYTVLNTPIAPAYTGWVIKTNAYGIDLLDECSTVPIIDQPTYTGVQMKVYPNPATTQITLNLPESKEAYQIRLIDLNGKIVYQASNQVADPTIDIESLPSGMYVVQILSKHNTVINAQKFVKMD
jgi:Secretion system C-terminal sorting domain